MNRDLSNARIIEWECEGTTYVASRSTKGRPFAYVGPVGVETAPETEARKQNGVRIVAEFPRPTLAGVVGEAPAFWFVSADNIPFIACRAGDWRGPGDDGHWYALPRHRVDRLHMFEGPLFAFPEFDLASVVPLVPREVAA